MGRYDAPDDLLYSVSGTFCEDQPSRVYLNYFGATVQNSSVSVGMQGSCDEQRKCQLQFSAWLSMPIPLEASYKYSHDQATITNGLGLISNLRANCFGEATSRS